MLLTMRINIIIEIYADTAWKETYNQLLLNEFFTGPVLR